MAISDPAAGRIARTDPAIHREGSCSIQRDTLAFDLPKVVQMAIKIAAVKQRKTIGELVSELVSKALPEYLHEAREALKKLKETSP